LTLPTLELPLARASGYRLAQVIVAAADIPSNSLCARDGYAVNSAETLGAGDYNPLPLRLQDADRAIHPGSAAKVSAGDPLPQGADAVLSPEQGEPRSAFVDVGASLAPGEAVTQTGEECRKGQTLLEAGHRLRPQDIAWLTQAGLDSVEVQARPRVRLVLAGRFERDANGPMLSELIPRDGAELLAIDRCKDGNDLRTVLTNHDAELTLVVGGSGYGEHDYSVQTLHDTGSVDLDGATIHPGGSLVLGRVDDKPVIILPGTPLACLCAYDLVAARQLRRLSGLPGESPYPSREMTLSRKLVSRIGLLELARMRIVGDQAEPLAVADDRLLSSSVHADGFTLLAENSEGHAEGSRVTVYLYDQQNPRRNP
jgi:molybdopterin molybdotransferase